MMLITGDKRGLGAAYVKVFTEAGWGVVAASRADANVHPALPGAEYVRWDVTDDETGPLTTVLGGRPLNVFDQQRREGR